MMRALLSFLTVAAASAAWTDSPKLEGISIIDGNSRFVRCVPCEERRGDPSRSASNGIDYRGNGADNLGYDWSPKAWGGPAFPPKQDRQNGPDNSRWNDRDGRRMPGWGCADCGRDQDRDRSNNQYPYGGSSTRDEVTVTSSVLGIRHKDDKRLPVDWAGDGRSMRWDGFRNGMPHDRPDSMDRREGTGFRPWDGTNRGVSGWDSEGKGHYAADWSYGSGPKWNDERPWTQTWDGKPPGNDRSYNQGGNNLFGNSYPTTDRNPPTYSTWRPPTSTYPNKPFYQYPETGRPPLDSGPHGGYQTTSRPNYPSFQPSQPNQPWNSNADRYGSRPDPWPAAPNQNYLPSNRPGFDRPNPDYGRPSRPSEGKPGMAIWNGSPEHGRPVRPPQGFYQGFITELPNSNNNGPYDRPGSGGGNGYNQDRYPTKDRYPSERPGYGDRGPPGRPWPGDKPYDHRIPDHDKNGYGGGGLGPNRYPDYDKSPNPSYPRPGDRDRDRYPSYGGNRPNQGNDRYPSYNGDRGSDRYPNNDRNKIPPYDSDRDRRPSYGSDRDRDRLPSYGNDRDRPPSYNDRDNDNRYPSYGGDGPYGNDRDRDDNRYPSYGGNKDRYPSPSRPGSNDYDRGPNPSSDSGSWNYGEEQNKDGTYRRSGGSYPPYKGGQYYTSSYLASASTPAASSQELDNKKETTDSPAASAQD